MEKECVYPYKLLTLLLYGKNLPGVVAHGGGNFTINYADFRTTLGKSKRIHIPTHILKLKHMGYLGMCQIHNYYAVVGLVLPPSQEKIL